MEIDDEEYTRCSKTRWHLLKRKTCDQGFPFYVQGRVDGKNVYLHRYLLGDVLTKSQKVDHIDRNPLNNRKSNLRVVSSSLNNRNRLLKNKTSRFPGVSKTKSGKWLVSFCLNRRKTSLGTYALEEVAARVYRDAALATDPHLHFTVWEEL